MSTLALFLALAGGTAVAATTLPRNSVTSATVKDNSLTSKDLMDGKAVRRADVVASQVQLRVRESCPEGQAIRVIDVKGGVTCEVDDQGGGGPGGGPPTGAAGGDLAGSYPNPLVRNGAITSAKVADGTLTGADVSDNALTGDDINEATLGRVPSALLGGLGRSGATTTCNPESFDYAFCAATEIIDVPPGARALVFGSARAVQETPGRYAVGRCRLSASSIGPLPNRVQNLFLEKDVLQDSFTLLGVTAPLSPGPTSFAIECNEIPFTDTGGAKDGGIHYHEISASVVLISGA